MVIFRLFRSLFPSWRFFEEHGPTPVLLFRPISADGAKGDWVEALTPPKRNVYHLFFNTETNLHLLHVNLVHELVNESRRLANDKAELLVHTTPYLLLRNIIEIKLKEVTTDKLYQFKVCARSSGESQDILISPQHGCGK